MVKLINPIIYQFTCVCGISVIIGKNNSISYTCSCGTENFIGPNKGKMIHRWNGPKGQGEKVLIENRPL